VNAQFADPLSDRRSVASMSVSKTIQTGCDRCACPFILEPRPPSSKLFRLLQFEAWVDVVDRLQIVKEVQPISPSVR
jgi:hypothetical protein